MGSMLSKNESLMVGQSLPRGWWTRFQNVAEQPVVRFALAERRSPHAATAADLP